MATPELKIDKVNRVFSIAPMPAGKISLGLRTLIYEKELTQMRLPRDAEALINALFEMDRQELEIKYKQAFYFTTLKQKGEFYKDYGFRSLTALLVKLGLPMGKTLATREAIVKLFSYETFVTVGDDLLSEMIRSVTEYQKDPRKKESDYQHIFDEYCKSYSAFDRKQFLVIVRWYIRTRYINPKLKKVEDNTARLPRQRNLGQRTIKQAFAADSEEAQAAPHGADFELITTQCAGCLAWREYAEEWERFAKDKSNLSELGAKRLPVKPKGLI